MKIASSDISFQSSHTKLELNQKQENLQFWVGNNPGQNQEDQSGVTLNISEKAIQLQKSASSSTSPLDEELENALSAKDKQKLLLLEKLMEHLTGKKLKLRIPKAIKLEENASLYNGAQPMVISQGNGVPRAGWGLSYDSVGTHHESEKVSFSSKGTILTSDGKSIRIDLELNMSREFMSREELHIRAGDAVMKDPLVINFGAPAASLTDTKFSFDIDSDGTADQISNLSSGSGFLSLDLNNDGKINDGSELFGPKSGDGFSDLALYDEDSNGWIDENDSIFDKLRIWTRDESGNSTLFALGQKGVGAIYLGNASTSFSLMGQGNKENGVIQKTGIFLNENGTAGTIQHIDLAV
ncbi:MAG TPA: hypothetical protein VN549_02690 [Negativicutes bacterium]|nr:hypothetical protein [Negativicutes bacterium]